MKQRTALISVYHKEGIDEFARALVDRGWQILASGGTAKFLESKGIKVKDVGEMAGKPILGHRVVTLAREIHAALLARKLAEDDEELSRIGFPRIDLLCVDLYPLSAAIAALDSNRNSVIEMTDVGGPTLLHSAAKGERIVICDPADHMKVIEWLGAGSPDEEKFIDYLDAKADALVAECCLTSSRYRGKEFFDGFIGTKIQECKYGENAWQVPAGLYKFSNNDPLALSNFKVVGGDVPGYNNFCDVDRMLQTITHIIAGFDINFGNCSSYVAVGVKHGNSCGVSVSESAIKAVQEMVTGDRRAIFGGLVMVNFVVNDSIAKELLHFEMPEGARRLLDGVVASRFSPEAIELLARKGGKCWLIENPALGNLTKESLNKEPRFRAVRGGFLKQPNYTFVLDLKDPRAERIGDITPEQEKDLVLAWAIGSTSNSNTVTLVKDRQLIGNGVGQQDRVGCSELAVKRAKDAGHDINGAVAYSDSFFPFTDGPMVLAQAGIKAILATSGSVRDEEVKTACKEKGVSLVLIPDVMARGFYNH